jgi:hypothetical protein
VPLVIPSRPTKAQAEGQFVGHHQGDTGETEGEAKPLALRHSLAQQRPGHGGGDNRLQADDQRRHAGADPLAHGQPDAAEIDRLEHHPDDRDVTDLTPTGRPRRAHSQGNAKHQHGNKGIAQTEECEGLGMGEADLGGDEATAPQQHEQRRNGGVSTSHGNREAKDRGW